MELTVSLSRESIEKIAQKVASINAQAKEAKIKEVRKTTTFFTVVEVAEMLKKEPQTIRDHIRKKILVAHKTGKSWTVSQENLNKYTNNEQ